MATRLSISPSASNHLLLKGVVRPAARDAYLVSFGALADGYLAGVSWESAAAVEARVARLLPALLLARIDGKSPVEYITADADKARVRAFARPRIATPPLRLRDVRRDWGATG